MRVEIKPENWVNGCGYRKNGLANEADLACPGALVQVVVMAPGDAIPDHVHHNSTEFYFVAGGACRLIINEESHVLVGWLAIHAQTQGLSPALAKRLELKIPSGVLVVELERGGPGEVAGLHPGDVILRIDGDQVPSVDAIFQHLDHDRIGSRVKLQVLRRGGLLVDLDVEVQARPDS